MVLLCLHNNDICFGFVRVRNFNNKWVIERRKVSFSNYMTNYSILSILTYVMT